MAKWIELFEEWEDNNDCPFAIMKYLNLYYENAPGCEYKTKKVNEFGETIGCRGISCEECWDQESGVK